jgi:hypothetical protein
MGRKERLMQEQDSDDPTGVKGEAAGNHAGGRVVPGNSVTRARNRKSNAAIQMRLAGASWTEICVALGYPTPRAALVAVEKALERELRTEPDRDKMRQIAGARLDRLLRSVWPKAIDTESPEQMVAVQRSRELIADWRKVYGLDAPTEVVVHSPTQRELEAWVVQVTAANTAPVEELDIINGEVEESHDIPQPG